ncbi:hypothetical protein D3C72_1751110 [compost metagenome]
MGCDAIAIDHHGLINEGAAGQLLADGGEAGHAPLPQYAKGLQSQCRRLGDGGEPAPGGGLVLEQLLQGLMGRQVLGTHGTAGQDNQVERLCQHIHQHCVGGQASTSGTGQHAPCLDAGHHHFDFRPAQHVNQADGLQVVDAFGKGNQGSKGHGLRPQGDL